MNLTEKEIKEYQTFLREHYKDMRDFAPVLGPRAKHFSDLVILLFDPKVRDLTTREFALKFRCSKRTLNEAIRVIRQKRLPFKYTERLDCRRIALLTKNSAKPIRAGTLATGFTRYRKKYGTNIVTDVTKTVP